MAIRTALRALVPGALALALLAACSGAADTAAPAQATAGAPAATGLADAVNALRGRIIEQLPLDALEALGPAEALALATDDERELLATGFLGFT